MRVRIAVACKQPPEPLPKAKITLIRVSSTEPDYDGLVSSFKSVLDGLIVCGIIENDRMSNIGKSDYSWVKGKRGEGKIQVVVESVD